MSDDLITIDEIADMLYASRRTVAERWIHRPDFPRPVIRATRVHRFWSRREVMAWASGERKGTKRGKERQADAVV